MVREQKVWQAAALGVVLIAACGKGGPKLPEPKNDQVSIGYSTETKESFTGAVSSLSAEELKDRPVSRIEQLLEGRVAGLEVLRRPNGEYTLRIRGARSLKGGDEPLIVVDGTPVRAGGITEALAGLTRQDIANIDVLKDAGSTAIYGSRGANGVIVIRTKRGHK